MTPALPSRISATGTRPATGSLLSSNCFRVRRPPSNVPLIVHGRRVLEPYPPEEGCDEERRLSRRSWHDGLDPGPAAVGRVSRHRWNRTVTRADPLVREGAIRAPRGGRGRREPVVVVCVYDYGRPTGPPDEGGRYAVTGPRPVDHRQPRERESARPGRARRGAGYLEARSRRPRARWRGPTPRSSCRREPVSAQRAGPRGLRRELKFLGEQVGAASAMDLATLSYVYGAMLGFLHGGPSPSLKGSAWTLRRARGRDLAKVRRVLQARRRGDPVGRLRGVGKPAADLGRSDGALGPGGAGKRDQRRASEVRRRAVQESHGRRPRRRGSRRRHQGAALERGRLKEDLSGGPVGGFRRRPALDSARPGAGRTSICMATSVTTSPKAPAAMKTSAMPRPIPVPNQSPMSWTPGLWS